MKRILFLGSKPIGFLCFEYLVTHAQDLNIEIAGVLSNDNTRFGVEYSVKALSKKCRIPFIEELDDILEMEDIDFLVSVQYHRILKEQHIAVANVMAINLHMAPLPEYRGCNQFSFALYNGENIFGTTLHRLEKGIDSGDIIFERRFQIPADCDVKTLYDITFESSVQLFKDRMGAIFKGDYELTSQESLLDRRKTNLYYRKDISTLKQIPLNEEDKAELELRVKSTSMPGFEPPYINVGEKKYYIIPEDQFNQA